MSKLLSSLFASLLSSIAVHASAATIVQGSLLSPFAQHHREFTITAAPGELVYLPIPRQNFPVRVEVSVPNIYPIAGANAGPLVGSLTVVEIGGNAATIHHPYTSNADHISGATNSYNGMYYQAVIQHGICSSYPVVNNAMVYYMSAGGGGGTPGQVSPCGNSIPDSFIYGIVPPGNGNPHRLVFGMTDPSGSAPGVPYYTSVTFYVSMWY